MDSAIKFSLNLELGRRSRQAPPPTHTSASSFVYFLGLQKLMPTTFQVNINIIKKTKYTLNIMRFLTWIIAASLIFQESASLPCWEFPRKSIHEAMVTHFDQQQIPASNSFHVKTLSSRGIITTLTSHLEMVFDSETITNIKSALNVSLLYHKLDAALTSSTHSSSSGK